MNILRRKTESGSALLYTFTLLVIAMVAVGSLLSFVVFQQRSNARYEMYFAELNAAEYALNTMLGTMKFYAYDKPDQVGASIQAFSLAIQDIGPPTLEGYEFTQAGVRRINGDQYDRGTVESGKWVGYPVIQLIYEVTVRAKKSGGLGQHLAHPGVMLRRQVVVTSIPLYIYGIFYANLLEIWPGPEFDMFGMVHTNRDL